MTTQRFASFFLLSTLFACGGHPAEHGHSHGGGDGHGDGDHGGHGGHGDGEGESIAVTRWTESHELFVELDAPVAGKPFAYHAHVTRLVDNHAADSGTLQGNRILTGPAR
jgi:hypothetical protein